MGKHVALKKSAGGHPNQKQVAEETSQNKSFNLMALHPQTNYVDPLWIRVWESCSNQLPLSN
jgi:hypothetical protein